MLSSNSEIRDTVEVRGITSRVKLLGISVTSDEAAEGGLNEDGLSCTTTEDIDSGLTAKGYDESVGCSDKA